MTSGARLPRPVAPLGPGRDGAAGGERPPRPRPALGVRGLRARAAQKAAPHALGPLRGASEGIPLRRAAPEAPRRLGSGAVLTAALADLCCASFGLGARPADASRSAVASPKPAALGWADDRNGKGQWGPIPAVALAASRWREASSLQGCCYNPRPSVSGRCPWRRSGARSSITGAARRKGVPASAAAPGSPAMWPPPAGQVAGVRRVLEGPAAPSV